MHISDTHGKFPKLHGKFDCVVHSGDFFPNSYNIINGNKTQEAVFQMNWLTSHIHDIKDQLDGSPFLFVLGNHDFVNPILMEHFLNSEGVKAFDLTDRVVSYQSTNFFGFPYVPAIGGNNWNYEREIPEMQVDVDRMIDTLNKTYVDVVVAHAPIYKCLDFSYGNQYLGSTVIANAFDYKISKDMQPMCYLHGHIHEAHGVTMRNSILVSNSAITHKIIEI